MVTAALAENKELAKVIVGAVKEPGPAPAAAGEDLEGRARASPTP